jgi:hypothetical protein
MFEKAPCTRTGEKASPCHWRGEPEYSFLQLFLKELDSFRPKAVLELRRRKVILLLPRSSLRSYSTFS